MSAELIEGFDRLPALRKDWEELFLARANEPSTSLEWTSAMVRHHVRVRLPRPGQLLSDLLMQPSSLDREDACVQCLTYERVHEAHAR